MTEKEKMRHQKLYDANYDKELEAERLRCKSLFQKYNNLPIENIDARHEFIKTIIGKTGKNIHIEPDFWCDYGYRITVGENFYSNHGLVILDAGGVTIGNNVVIGGGSIVTRDIPSNSVAAGNPCKVIRQITGDDKKKNWDR